MYHNSCTELSSNLQIVLYIHKVTLFDYLVFKEIKQQPDVGPLKGHMIRDPFYLPLDIQFFLLHSGRNVLNLATSCKAILHELKPIIENTLHFRCKTDGPFQYYSPKLLTVLSQSSLPNIPSSPTHLIFGPDCTVLSSLPPSVTHLTATNININIFPPRLSYLCCMTETNNSDWNLPTTLTHLSLSCESNFPQFPSSLTHLRIRGRSLPTLPSGITHLTIEGIEDDGFSLPPLLTSLTMIYCEFITQMPPFPLSLTHLTLQQTEVIFPFPPLPPSLLEFSLQLENTVDPFPELPSSLRLLVLPADHDEITSLPPNLIHFEEGHHTNVTCPLPNAIRYLQFPYLPLLSPTIIPPNVSHLWFSMLYVTSFVPLFPNTLTHLQVNFPIKSSQVPLSLTHLFIRLERDHNNLYLTTLYPFPACITHLTLYLDSQSIPDLPPKLIYLSHFGTGSLPNLPLSLRHLFTCGKLPPSLPPFLTYLKVETTEYPNLPDLPPSLSHLSFSGNFHNLFDPFPPLPPNLIYLSLRQCVSNQIELVTNKKRKRVEGPPFDCIPSGLLWFSCSLKWFDFWNVKSLLPPMCHTIFLQDDFPFVFL